jgi:hypothetical protein
MKPTLPKKSYEMLFSCVTLCNKVFARRAALMGLWYRMVRSCRPQEHLFLRHSASAPSDSANISQEAVQMNATQTQPDQSTTVKGGHHDQLGSYVTANLLAAYGQTTATLRGTANDSISTSAGTSFNERTFSSQCRGVSCKRRFTRLAHHSMRGPAGLRGTANDSISTAMVFLRKSSAKVRS